MNPTETLSLAINPALDRLAAHKIPSSDSARAMLYAIGLQESALKYHWQLISGPYPRGPARGLWQFEAGGGVAGVLAHKSSAVTAQHFAREFAGSVNSYAVWATLAYEDVLAAVFARLLLWTDPKALPAPVATSEQAAWDYYKRNWRPGAPHPEKWAANWKAALDVLKTAKEIA